MRKFYFVLLSVFMQLACFSQTDILIGSGTAGNAGTGYPCPLQDYYEGSRMQYLYLASELTNAGMTPGTINGIKFEVTSLNSFSGTIEQFKLGIGGTATQSLTNNSWESGLTDVYGPVDYAAVTGTNELVFSAPFFWNGTDNIVIEVCNGDPNNGTVVTYTQNPTIFYTTGLSFNGSHSYRADNLGNLCGTATTTNSGTQTTRPDITFEWIPASTTGCYLPSGITIANITATSADASWNPPASGSTPAQYMWELRTSGAPGSGSTGLVTSGNTATTAAVFSSLGPITTYYFYIMTDCGSGNASIWSSAHTFITGCAAIAAFNQNFEGVVTPALPQCWTNILRGGTIPAAAYVQTATGNAYSNANSISMYNSSATSTDDIILVTPQLSNVGAGTYRLTFYARNTLASEDIEVGTLDDNTSAATFTPLQVVDINTTYAKYTISFSGYAGTDQYIGLRRQNNGTFNYVYIDNIIWEPVPSCEVPSALTHSNVDTSHAQLNWTPPVITSPVGYHIFYSTANTPPSASTAPSDSVTAATFYNLSLLTSGTKYYVWVRSNCGGGDVSVWTNVDTFTTANPGYVSVDISGLNADVIADGIGAPTGSTTYDVDNVFYEFIAADYQYDATCPLPLHSLPISRQIYHNGPGLYFKLAPYNGDNDLRLTSTDVGTLTFNTAVAAEKVYLLATSGSGASQVNVDVNFSDGSIQTFSNLSISDWFGTTANMVLGGIGRVINTTTDCSGVSTSATDPKLYEVLLTLDAANYLKTISGITVTRIDGVTGFTGLPNILAISAKLSGALLPVTLTDFKGYHTEGGNRLGWNTVSESNNKGFEIQRSVDGQHFSKMAFAESKAIRGNSTANLNYSYLDEKPLAGTNYYRLKQTDKDGKSSLSAIVAIKSTGTNLLLMTAIYPNPVQNKMSLVLSAPVTANEVTLVITDVTGKVVLQQKARLQSGDNNILLNLSALHSGSYLIKAICENGCQTAVRKFVKN